MFGNETWQVALDALRANKVKAFLTMLGVVIGSACIVMVVTVGLSGKQYILAQIEGVGANIVYAEFVRAGVKESAVLSDELSLADMEAVRAGIPQVAEVAATREIPQTVVVGGVERPVALVGVTEGFQRIRNLVVLRGRFLDADDMTARSKNCVITQELSNLLFPAEDPVGRSVRLGELSFTIVGVFRERVATFGQSEIRRESVVIPFSLMKYYTDDFVRVLYAQAKRPEDVQSVTRQVEQMLRSRHRAEAVYLVQNLTSLLDAAKNISFALSIILILIAFIALVISGIGIMNIMLVTVTQRTREIGIRKAIGARRKEILSQFLLEAFLISGTGGVIGIAIAVLIPVMIEPLLPGNLSVPISGVSIAVAFLVSCFTGILFGYLPANRAAKLQPTESLRYE
ncbi:MAG: ABC transporter permease [Acidobacteria bacterium]|nr:ABC transporter permease [Acidobacteriota bacterium]